MNTDQQTRSLQDVQKYITYLKFLKTHILTPENIAQAKALGLSLGTLLGEVYSFIQYVRALNASGARGSEMLVISRQLHEAGVTETLEMLGKEESPDGNA